MTSRITELGEWIASLIAFAAVSAMVFAMIWLLLSPQP